MRGQGVGLFIQPIELVFLLMTEGEGASGLRMYNALEKSLMSRHVYQMFVTS